MKNSDGNISGSKMSSRFADFSINFRVFRLKRVSMYVELLVRLVVEPVLEVWKSGKLQNQKELFCSQPALHTFRRSVFIIPRYIHSGEISMETGKLFTPHIIKDQNENSQSFR